MKVEQREKQKEEEERDRVRRRKKAFQSTEERKTKLKRDAFVAQAPPGVRDHYIKSFYLLLDIVNSPHIKVY